MKSPHEERTRELCGCKVLWHAGNVDVPEFYTIQRCELHLRAGEMVVLLTRVIATMSERNPLGRSIRLLLSGIRKDIAS